VIVQRSLPLRSVRLWKTFRSKPNAIPVADKKCLPSHRNGVRLQSGMLFGITTVDAPCGWSQSTSSRLAEQDLKLLGKKIHCFATPTLARAQAHKKGFYGWVFNGEKLYRLLAPHYPIYDGRLRSGPICFETFSHAIVCAFGAQVVPAKPKELNRRKVLRGLGYDDSPLSNIDFIDAALCAVTAEEFRKGRTIQFGTRDEGFIVVPAPECQ
jgi:predicted nuclease with RNAse H fold